MGSIAGRASVNAAASPLRGRGSPRPRTSRKDRLAFLFGDLLPGGLLRLSGLLLSGLRGFRRFLRPGGSLGSLLRGGLLRSGFLLSGFFDLRRRTLDGSLDLRRDGTGERDVVDILGDVFRDRVSRIVGIHHRRVLFFVVVERQGRQIEAIVGA